MEANRSNLAAGSNPSQFPNVDTWNFDGCYYNITEDEDPHHNEHVHQEQGLPTQDVEVDNNSAKKKVARRAKNSSHQEDEVICSAWINVSQDAIISMNQTSGGYWKTNMFPSGEPEVTIRPEGRDSCKRKRGNKNTTPVDSTACVEVLERMTKNRELVEVKRDEHYKELLARRDRELDLQEQEMEFKIMAVNIGEVPKDKRGYYLNLQRRIMEKSNKDNNSST